MLRIQSLKVKTVLEIGPGEAIAALYMRSLGIQYDTMDIVADSKPTIFSKIEDFDPVNHLSKYEMVCAFQMLEHSPYELFIPNILKMSKMSSEFVFISLPFLCAGFSFSVKLTFGQRLKFRKKIDFYFPLNFKNRKYRDEFKKEFPWAVHYWEIGRRGFSLQKIREDIKSTGLSIVDEFRSENPFHYFFLMKKR